MPLTVATQDLGYLEVEKQIESELEAVFKNRAEEWEVVLLGAQDNTKWEMTVKGPQSYNVRHTLYGEDGGHNPRYIAALLNAELNPAAREINLVVAELIREEAQYSLDGFVAGFLVIDGVNVSITDAIAMRQAGKLTRDEVQGYARRAQS